MPKVALLFLTRGDLYHAELWSRFLAGAPGAFFLAVHAKFPTAIATPWLRDSLCPTYVSTEWGSPSLITATLALCRHALTDADVAKVVLVSESCVPVKPAATVVAQLLQDECSWLACGPTAPFTLGDRIGPPHCYKGSQWVVLSRAHVEAVLALNCPPTIEGATPADEHYFPGVLSYLGYPPGCPTVRVRPVTFVDWEQREGGHPRTFGRLSEADVQQLGTTSCLFARKFAADSDVAAYWDRILQGG